MKTLAANFLMGLSMKSSMSFVMLLLFLAPLQRVEAGTLGKNYKDYVKLGDAFDNAWYGLDTLKHCQASGTKNCPLVATLCWAFKQFVEPAISANMVFRDYIEVAVNFYCLGEPRLKCCRRRSGGNCWSAFNTDAPINCEGNPNYGPTYTAGLCLSPCPSGCAGCLCNYLSECTSDARAGPSIGRQLLEGEPDREVWFQIGRMASFYSALSSSLRGRPALSIDNRTTAVKPSNGNMYGVPSWDVSASSQLLDFIFYRGCVDFLDNARLLTRSVPNVNITNWRGRVVDRGDDLFDEIIPIRAALPHFAASRLGGDIPDFWLKVNNIFANPWNSERRAVALSEAGVDDPESEILRYVDLGGLFILREVLGENWVLMAVPISDGGEGSLGRSRSGGLSRCRKGDGRGSPVKLLSFSLEVAGDTATFSMKIIDPLSSGEVLVRVSWGDSSPLEDFILDDSHGDERTLEESHTYTQCNPNPQVTIQIVNKSGLMILVKKKAEPTCIGSVTDLSSSPSKDDYPPIASVTLTLEVERAGNAFASPGSQVYYFQGAPAQAGELDIEELVVAHSAAFEPVGIAGADASTQPISVVFSFNSQSMISLQYIRFTCRTFDHYVYTSASAKVTSVKLHLLSGVVVENVPFEVETHGDGSGLYCSRRGNLFEDEQNFFAISLAPVGDGTARLDENVNSRLAENLSADGFYQEVLPGSFRYATTLEDLGGGVGGEDQDCVDDKDVRITAYFQKGRRKMNCAGLALRKRRLRKWYCRWIKKARNQCKETCGTCNTGTGATCADSSNAGILPVFKSIKKNCSWLAEQNRNTIDLNCKTRNIARSCPRTCDKC